MRLVGPAVVEHASASSVASRVYETASGLVHAIFNPTSVLLMRVPPDGWFPLFGGGTQSGRSHAELVRALRQSGGPAEQVPRLAEEILADWEAIEIQEERTRRHELVDVLRFAALLFGLLVRTPRFIWEVLRGRSDLGEAQEEFVRPGSSEYGVIRLVRTSVGWAEFEFWGGRQVTLGVYREDGWQPLSAHRHYLERPDVIDALRAHGLSQEEAEDLYALVVTERQARIARHPQ